MTTLFKPTGKIKQRAFLRRSAALFLCQVLWVVFVYAALAYVMPSPPTSMLWVAVSLTYPIFLYLYYCLYAQRLAARGCFKLWLIPIGLAFCAFFALTSKFATIILPINIEHYVSQNHIMILLHQFSVAVISFSAFYITSLCVAFWPNKIREDKPANITWPQQARTSNSAPRIQALLSNLESAGKN